MTFEIARDIGAVGLAVSQLEASGQSVASFVNRGFESYVRILNPVVAGHGTSASTYATWRSFAGSPVAVDGSRIQWVDVVRARELDAQVGEPSMGQMEPRTAVVLAGILRRHTMSPRECFFAWWVGYADVRVPSAALRVTFPPGREMFVMRGDVGDAGRDHSSFGIARRPLRWMPAGGEWGVGNDIYARSVFVGGTASMVAEILGHPELEAYEVTTETTVAAEDW